MYNVFIKLSSGKTLTWQFFGYSMFEITSAIAKYPIIYGIPVGVSISQLRFHKVYRSIKRL